MMTVDTSCVPEEYILMQEKIKEDIISRLTSKGVQVIEINLNLEARNVNISFTIR